MHHSASYIDVNNCDNMSFLEEQYRGVAQAEEREIATNNGARHPDHEAEERESPPRKGKAKQHKAEERENPNAKQVNRVYTTAIVHPRSYNGKKNGRRKKKMC